jgi:hypothetical protein
MLQNQTRLEIMISSVIGFRAAGIELTFGHVILIVLVVFILKNLVRYLEAMYSIDYIETFCCKDKKRIHSSCLEILSTQRIVDRILVEYKIFLRVVLGRLPALIEAYLSTVQNGVMVLVYVVMASIANFEFALFVFVGALSNKFFI